MWPNVPLLTKNIKEYFEHKERGENYSKYIITKIDYKESFSPQINKSPSPLKLKSRSRSRSNEKNRVTESSFPNKSFIINNDANKSINFKDIKLQNLMNDSSKLQSPQKTSEKIKGKEYEEDFEEVEEEKNKSLKNSKLSINSEKIEEVPFKDNDEINKPIMKLELEKPKGDKDQVKKIKEENLKNENNYQNISKERKLDEDIKINKLKENENKQEKILKEQHIMKELSKKEEDRKNVLENQIGNAKEIKKEQKG